MGERPENRVDRIVNGLLRGRRLKLRGGDAEEKEAIIMAARLAAAKQGQQRMSPAFRQRLPKELGGAPAPGSLVNWRRHAAGFLDDAARRARGRPGYRGGSGRRRLAWPVARRRRRPTAGNRGPG